MAASMNSFNSMCFNFISRRICLLPRQCQQLYSVQTQAADKQNPGNKTQGATKKSANKKKKKIIVPNKIPRGPTSILEALASTVKIDPNAGEYVFVDDPFLLAKKANVRQNFLLSKAAGRKAARYIIDRYPRYFSEDHAVPSIKGLLPRKIEYDKQDVSEEALKERITCRHVEHALQVYKQLQVQDVEVSLETKLDLLDLLCVYNCKDVPEWLSLEDEYFPEKSSRVLVREWINNNEAEKLFADLPEKSARAYNSLVHGMATYLNIHKAESFYQQMIKDSLPVDVETFNILIRHFAFTKDKDKDTVLAKIEMYLKAMKDQGVQPNVKTFEGCLFACYMRCYYDEIPAFAMKIFSEMKTLNIEPTLGCFKLLIEIFYKYDNCKSKILHQIFDYVYNKNYEITGSLDNEFVFFSLIKCYWAVKDVDLARTIIQFAENNPKFFLNFYNKQIIYDNYFKLIIKYESLDEVIKEFNRLVPYQHLISANNICLLCDSIDLFDGYSYIPTIWAGMAQCGLERVQNSLTYYYMLQLMAKKTYPEKLQTELCDIIDKYFTNYLKEKDDPYRPVLSPPMFANLIQIALNSGQNDLAWNIFQEIENSPPKRSEMTRLLPPRKVSEYAVPQDETLSPVPFKTLAEVCITEMEGQKAMEVIKFMNKKDIPGSADLVNQILKLELNDINSDELSDMLL